MARLTWGDAKEIVEISLELEHTNQAIVGDLRTRTGMGLIDSIHRLFSLLAVADHPVAETRYESMRAHYSRLNSSPAWKAARLRLKTSMPAKEFIW